VNQRSPLANVATQKPRP